MTEPTSKTHCTRHWRYSVPNENHEGWAILFLDEAGCFAVLSDWGDYSYRWNARGFGEDRGIREFLLGCDDGYLMGKLSPERLYDGAATRKAVEQHIREELDGKEHDDELDLLDLADLDTEFGFHDWWGRTKVEDVHELVRRKDNGRAVAFLKRAWPRLKVLIKAELDAEKAEAPHAA